MFTSAWVNIIKRWSSDELSLAIFKKLGDVHGESVCLNNTGRVYHSLNQYPKALEFYGQSLAIARKLGDVESESACLGNIANLHIDLGDWPRAEAALTPPLADPCIRGRLALAKSDFVGASALFQEALNIWRESKNADFLFLSHTGLGLAYEGLRDYNKAVLHFRQAVDLSEEIRDTLTTEQKVNFYQAQILSMPRMTPYEGLARVLLKMNKPLESFKAVEFTLAWAFAERLTQRAEGISADVPKSVRDADTTLNGTLAGLLLGLQKASEKGLAEAVESFEKQVEAVRTERDAHISRLRHDYPLFASTKYPQPMDLKDSALRDNEWAIEMTRLRKVGYASFS